MEKKEKVKKALNIAKRVCAFLAIALVLFCILRNCVFALPIEYYGSENSPESALYVPCGQKVYAPYDFPSTYPFVVATFSEATLYVYEYNDGIGGYEEVVIQQSNYTMELICDITSYSQDTDNLAEFSVYVRNNQNNAVVATYDMNAFSGNYYNVPPMLILYNNQNANYGTSPYAQYILSRCIIYDTRFALQDAEGMYSQGYTAGYANGTTDGYTDGYETGEQAGYTDGYTDGTADGYEIGEQAGYTDGYTDGYNVGSVSYDIGYTAGYNDGRTINATGYYQSGYDAGVAAGYTDGYNAASSDTGNPFYQLINAIIFAPVNTFVSLLSFEVFGINMLHVALFLITATIIFVIISAIMRFKS